MGGFTTLVGILVHSAADGIALGAAAFAENAATGALISVAIILHKVRVESMRNTRTHLLNPSYSSFACSVKTDARRALGGYRRRRPPRSG